MPGLTGAKDDPESVIFKDLPSPGLCKNQSSDVSGERSSSGYSSEDDSTSPSSRNMAEENTRSNTTPPEPIHRKPALIVQLTSTKARLTVIQEDGRLSPLQNEDGKYSIPFWMARIRTRFLVFGTDVLKYATRAKSDPKFKQHFKYWDVGLIIQYNHPWRELTKFFDDKPINLTGELVIGMFFHFLKNLAETKFGFRIEQIVLTVPLWFGSLHRQRLKDAAIIAGFDQVLLMNEISILSHLHMSSKRTDVRTPQQAHFLAVTENSGNVDLAYFTSRAGSLTMVACDGNLHVSNDKVQNLMKEKCEELKKSDNKDRLKSVRVNMVEGMLKDLKKRIPLSEKPPGPVEVTCFCEDLDWLFVLEELKDLDTRCEVRVYEHFGAPPIIGNSDDWKPPTATCSDLYGDVINDLHPFPVFRSDASIKIWKVKFDEDSSRQSNGIPVSSVTNYPTTSSVIYQKDVLGRELAVGTIEVLGMLYYRYSHMKIQLTVGKDGIIKFNNIFACNSKGDYLKQLESPREYKWTPNKITPKELEINCKNCEEYINSGQRYKLDVMETKESTWKICEDISERIWNECFLWDVPKTKKNFVEKRVDRVLDVFRTNLVTGLELNLETIQRYKMEMERFRQYFK